MSVTKIAPIGMQPRSRERLLPSRPVGLYFRGAEEPSENDNPRPLLNVIFNAAFIPAMLALIFCNQPNDEALEYSRRAASHSNDFAGLLQDAYAWLTSNDAAEPIASSQNYPNSNITR